MTTVSYLISITTAHTTSHYLEVLPAIHNIAGKGQAFFGSSNGTVNTNLWIIPKGRKNRQEVIAQLQAVPVISSVAVIALSKPIEESELAAVRELFADIGWDAGSVTDDEIVLFINDKLQGQHAYFIDFYPREMGRGMAKISIKPIEEHTGFSPEWLKKSNPLEDEMPDRELTMDDMKMYSVIVESVKEDIEPPPLLTGR